MIGEGLTVKFITRNIPLQNLTELSAKNEKVAIRAEGHIGEASVR